jgi:hypothetical protein
MEDPETGNVLRRRSHIPAACLPTHDFVTTLTTVYGIDSPDSGESGARRCWSDSASGTPEAAEVGRYVVEEVVVSRTTRAALLRGGGFGAALRWAIRSTTADCDFGSAWA